MHALWQTIILAIVGEIGTITSVEYLKLRILSEDTQMLLRLLLTLLVDEIDGGLEGDRHWVFILG